MIWCQSSGTISNYRDRDDMRTADFLNRVLPEGVHYLAYPTDKKTSDGRPIFGHKVFEAPEDALAIAQAMGDKDVYYAAASFKVAKILDPKNGYMKAYRKQENVSCLRSLYLDLDFKGYQTPADASGALKAFLDTHTIEKPTIIVATGGGLHVYWTFDEKLTPEQWKPLASGLAKMAEKAGLKADLAVTIDSARILRLPGTKNYKYDAPRECKVLTWRKENVSYERLKEQLEPYVTSPRINPADFRVSADVVKLFGPADNKDLVSNYDAGRTYRMAEIVERCPTLKDVLDRHGEGDSYAFWKDVLHLAAYTDDGEAWVAPLSSGHEGYNFEEAMARFDESVEVRKENRRGPTTCHRFSQHSSKCMSCSYWGHIKSPISLGVKEESKEAATVSFVIAGQTFINVPDEDGEGVTRKLVCNTALDQWSYGEDEEHGAYLRVRAKVGPRTKFLDIPASLIADPRALREKMLRNGVGVQDDQIKLFGRVCVAWLERLRETREATADSPSFGWSYNSDGEMYGFALNGVIRKPNGDDEMGGVVSEYARDAYEPRGSYDAWRRIADVMCEDERPEAHVLIATAFAAPLMRFSHASSFTMSFYSRHSGVGKTSFLQLAQAVWGHPSKAGSSLNDTPKSVAVKMAQTRDLPAYWDELRGTEDVDNFVKLIFQATQGKERQRLNAKAELKKAQEITTLMVVASNDPIVDAVRQHSPLSNAGILRLFQVEVPKPEWYGAVDVKLNSMLSGLKNNYGFAGRKYINFLVDNFDRTQAILDSTGQKLADRLRPKAEERFWFNAVTCLLSGAVMARQADICNINASKVAEYCVSMFQNSRKFGDDVEQGYSSVVADVVNIFADYVLVTKQGGSRGRASSWANTVYRPPARSARIQVAVEDDKVIISQRVLDEFAKLRQMPPTQLKHMMETRLGAKKSRITMGAGTVFTQPRIECYVLSASTTLGNEMLKQFVKGEMPQGSTAPT